MEGPCALQRDFCFLQLIQPLSNASTAPEYNRKRDERKNNNRRHCYLNKYDRKKDERNKDERIEDQHNKDAHNNDERHIRRHSRRPSNVLSGARLCFFSSLGSHVRTFLLSLISAVP